MSDTRLTSQSIDVCQFRYPYRFPRTTSAIPLCRIVSPRCHAQAKLELGAPDSSGPEVVGENGVAGVDNVKEVPADDEVQLLSEGRNSSGKDGEVALPSSPHGSSRVSQGNDCSDAVERKSKVAEQSGDGQSESRRHVVKAEGDNDEEEGNHGDQGGGREELAAPGSSSSNAGLPSTSFKPISTTATKTTHTSVDSDKGDRSPPLASSSRLPLESLTGEEGKGAAARSPCDVEAATEMVVDVEATPSEKKLRTTSAVSDEADDIAEVSAAGGEGAASGKSAGSATPAALEDGNESASETASAAVDVVDSDAAGISGLSSEEAGNLGVARSLPEKTAGAGCTLELDEEMNGGVEAAAVSKGGGDRQSGTSSADDGRKYREETAGAGGIVGGGGKNAIVDGSENVGDDVRVGEKYSVEVSAVMVGGVKRSAPEEDGIDAEGKDGVREREESGIGRPKAKR